MKSPQLNDGESASEGMWIEEQFWGHRLYDGQSPWLTFLEFIGVAHSAQEAGQLFDFEQSQYLSTYSALSRLHLRNILFLDEQRIVHTAKTYGDSDTAWSHWLEWIERNAKGLDPAKRKFGYLRTRFDSFHDFAALIRALRSCVVEGDTNKRWSSRFIFPFGPAALFEDLAIKDESFSREYINFGRSGELLYLMLARSSLRTELTELLPRVLVAQNKWNHLVQRLQPDTTSPVSPRSGAFLPYDAHPVFEILAADWLALLRLRLPGFDVVPHLVTSGAFGLLLYQLHTSAHLLGMPMVRPIICEVVAPKKGLVRELSTECFEENSVLSFDAMNCVIERVTLDPRWEQGAGPVEKLSNRRAVIADMFRWSDKNPSVSDPDELLRMFRSAARTRHQRHFGQVHRTFGRGVGLVSRRGTNRFRYAPTDHFLKFLVLATVDKRVEFGEFLEKLYRRYGLIFGEREAHAAKPGEAIDKKPFQQNALRLEQRLSSLGLLKRLSDACAYVENPYAE
ncbi:MAG: hypothetical protein V4709_12600 [Pseudomonadota bacterium]